LLLHTKSAHWCVITDCIAHWLLWKKQDTSNSDAVTQQPGAATVTDVRTLQQYPASADIEQGLSQQTTVLNSTRSGNTVSDASTNYTVHSQPQSQSQSAQQQQQQCFRNSQASASDAVSTTAVAALSAEHSYSSAFENKSTNGSRSDAHEQQQQQQQQQQQSSPHAAVAVPVDTQQQQQQYSSAAVVAPSPVAAAAAVAVPYGHIVQPPQGALGQVTVCGQCGVSRGSAKDMHCRECGEYLCEPHGIVLLRT
jgi:hypothetical protein